MTSSTPSSPIAAHVHEQADALRAQFLGARPFGHCVIDDFFGTAFVDELDRTFPDFSHGNALNEDGEPGGKSTIEQIHTLGGSFLQLDRVVQSREFLALVDRITGIPDLLYDPAYFGGGTHENLDGQSLDNHIDFNYHPGTGWHRRLNLIVYLNRQWQDGWGGALELHRDPHDPQTDEVVRIAPLFNRCVIFETTEHSWHGFEKIALPDNSKHLSRRSVALYFYTRERPRQQVASRHSTVYVDRPAPMHFKPGRVLTDRDCAELHELLDRRDSHNRRLYGEIMRLQAQLDATAAGRILNAAKRVLWRRRAF